MTWTPLTTGGRSYNGAEIRFALRSQSKANSIRLTLSIRPDLLKKAGWSNGDKVRLETGIDDKTGQKLCRMFEVAGPGSSKIHQDGCARGNVEWSCAGAIRDAWTDNVTSMTDLAFVRVAKGEIVFELPEWEVEA